MKNNFGLTDEQVAFVLTHYQELTVSEMRRRLHLGAEKIARFLTARNLTPKQIYPARRPWTGVPPGHFNVDAERNWLCDDGDGHPRETPYIRRLKSYKYADQ